MKILLKKVPSISTTFQISFNTGSIDEAEGQKGFSHLVEHLLFEGTEKRKNAKIIASEIENLGGEFNAATSNERTYYYIKILGKHYDTALDILSDMVRNSTFEYFEKEKNVVLEEIKMLNDNPRFYQWIVFEKILFEGTAYAIPVYGYEKDLEQASKEDLLAYYKKHYVSDNATLTVVGNFDEEAVSEAITQYFGDWKGSVEHVQQKHPQNQTKVAEEHKDIQQVYITKGIICPKITHPDAPVFEVIDAILGKPQSGLLVDEIRNKRGLAYDVSTSFENFKEFSFFVINAGTDIKQKDAVEKMMLEIVQSLETIDGVEVQNAISHIEGKELLELEDTHNYAENITFWHMVAGEDLSQMYLENIKKVTKEDVIRVAQTYFKDIVTTRIIPKEKN
ncbi:MAG: M16 family metallopeptidase [Candidatus Woesearchaeota archaeon]